MSHSHPIGHNMAKYDRHIEDVSRFGHMLQSRYRITISELIYGLSFVLNFLMGKIIHLTSQEEEVYNYYNNKKNIFNQLFVKKGWFWTTLAMMLFYCIIIFKSQHHLANGTKKVDVLKSGLVKYVLATVWWIFFTQWFFGLPIMDKVYILTGGKCANISKTTLFKKLPKFNLQSLSQMDGSDEFLESKVITSYTCRKIGGSWVDGHDPSGHVFLLVHSSMYMFLEGTRYWKSWGSFRSSIVKLVDGVRARNVSAVTQFIVESPHVIIIALCSLWWFMLFMTNIYFHSLSEKLVGLGFGYLGVLAIYFVPRWVH